MTQTTTFSETITTPSVATTTMTGCKCSEIFLMNENRTQVFTGSNATTGISGVQGAFLPSLGIVGPLVRVNSEGWSRLLVWEIVDSTDRGNQATTLVSTIMGMRPAFNNTATGANTNLASIQTSSSPFILATNDTIVGTEGNIPFRWEPCPVIAGQVNPGTDPEGTPPVAPPMGCHSSGASFTFAKKPSGLQQTSYAKTEVNFSPTNTTFISGPAVIDVTGTTQIFHFPTTTPFQDEPGYFVGQFIS
tara:strand:- start:3372 stop:4112 length:741 start_codon:yes stop_codon:yes gene_type:complete